MFLIGKILVGLCFGSELTRSRWLSCLMGRIPCIPDFAIQLPMPQDCRYDGSFNIMMDLADNSQGPPFSAGAAFSR